MNSYFFVSSCDGGLYDTRKTDWAKQALRPKYSLTHATISSLHAVKATLRAGPFAWPGGYPLYLITSDGAALCFACARKEFRQIAWDYLRGCSTGWKVCACAINYEDTDLYCDHCNQQIESACGE